MDYEVNHDLDAPIDVVERALASPDLAAELFSRVDSMGRIDCEAHDVSDERIERTWRFEAKAPFKVLSAYNVTREMMIWDEVWSYDRRARVADFHIVPRPGVDPDANWRKRVSCGGRYWLQDLGDGRTRRKVVGEMRIAVPVIGRVVGRLAVTEVRKAYAAEAEALLALCSLV